MIRVAIAGASHQHVEYAVREVDQRPEFGLVGVSDESAAVARRYGEPRGAAVFTDHREMLQSVKPEIVVASGIYGRRSAVIVDALDAGCHVVADKPLCTTVAGLEEIRSARRRARGSLTLLLDKRFLPETVAALQLVESGALGTVVEVSSTGPHKLNPESRPAWFFDRSTYGGILSDLVTHDIDLALQFTRAASGTISGAVAGLFPGKPEFSLSGVATVRSPEQLMILEANWLTPAMSSVHGDYHMRVIGTEGVADLWWARGLLTLTTSNEGTHEVPLGNGHRPAEVIFDALATGQVPTMAAPDCFLVTQLALLAQESAEAGGKVIPWEQDNRTA